MKFTKDSLCRKSFLLSSFFFISVIEMFFVVAPLTESYTPMILLQFGAFALIIICWLLKAKLKIRFNVFILLLGGFLADMTVSALVTGSDRFSVDMIFYWSSFLMILFCCNIKKYRVENFLLEFLVMYGLFFSVGVFLQMMFTSQFEASYFSLFKGEYKKSVYRQVIFHSMYTGWTSQTFATCMNLAAAIFSSWVLWTKKRKKIWLVFLVVNVLAMFLTGKRGPTIFVLFSILFVELVILKRFVDVIKQLSRYIILAVVGGAGIFAYVSMQSSTSRNVIVRFMEMFNGSGDDDLSNGRFILWQIAIKKFSENPLFGIGWRQIPPFAIPYDGKEMYTHNVYLQVLAEQGLFGFVLYMAAVLYAIIDTYRIIRKKDNNLSGEGLCLLRLSFMIQLFLLLYSLTGNVLYDYNAILLYFFAFMLYVYAKNTINITGEEFYEKICDVYARRK